MISEALARGLPILATRAAGNVGVLGPRHPGLFPPGRAEALARLLLRCEREPAFVRALARASRRLAPAVAPAAERAAWRRLLAELPGAS